MTPKHYGRAIYKLPALSEVQHARTQAEEKASLVSWHLSRESHELVSAASGVTVSFELHVKQLETCKSFWESVGGKILSRDCFVNEVANYTVLHTDGFGAAPIAQLEGHGGFKIWFVFKSSQGKKQLVGTDEHLSTARRQASWFERVLNVAKTASANGWILIQKPGHAVVVPPNYYHSVLTVPERDCPMHLVLAGETRFHPDAAIARRKAKAWLNNYSRGDHNGQHRGDKDGRRAELDELLPPIPEIASSGRKRVKATIK